MRFVTAVMAVVVLALATTASASTGGGVHHTPTLSLYVSLGLVFGVALTSTALTLADWAKRLDPDGKVPTIVELLAMKNELLDDMRWIEGNLPTGHRTTVRTGLPSVAWRMLNQGVTPSKSRTAQIDEASGMLEAWSEVDCELVKLNGNAQAFRLSEAMAFIEAMNQEMASTLFYGNGGLTPEEFTGLAPRYSLSTATNGDNVIKAGGGGADNTSLWLIAWDPNTISGIFPKGSKAGLIHEDFGEQTIEVTAGVGGTRMRAYQERFQWQAGIAVKDWRYAVRVCNIDISDLAGGTPPDLISFMEQAQETLPDSLGSAAFYCNRTVRRYLRKQVRKAVGGGGGLTFENFAGKKVLMFDDIPVRRVDALLNTEALVA